MLGDVEAELPHLLGRRARCQQDVAGQRNPKRAGPGERLRRGLACDAARRGCGRRWRRPGRRSGPSTRRWARRRRPRTRRGRSAGSRRARDSCGRATLRNRRSRRRTGRRCRAPRSAPRPRRRRVLGGEAVPEVGAVVGRVAVAEGAGDDRARRRAGEVVDGGVAHRQQPRPAEPPGHLRRESLGVAGLRRPQHQRTVAPAAPSSVDGDAREYRPASHPSTHSRTAGAAAPRPEAPAPRARPRRDR